MDSGLAESITSTMDPGIPFSAEKAMSTYVARSIRKVTEKRKKVRYFSFNKITKTQ